MFSEIKTILYATDLGEHTRTAFRLAVSLAKTNNAKILFLYVVKPLSAAAMSSVSVYLPPNALKEMRQQSIERIHEKVQERIKRFCDEEMKGEEFPRGGPEPLVIEGNPAATIIKTAEDMHADLIIMGAHSHGPIDRLFVGSVANKVVNRSTIPVLLVPIKD
jgi:nucleotide-binding universal stress UspA family protein